MSRKISILYALLGQFFLVLSIPIVTRIFLPETVGFYGEILAIATVIGVNSALKLDVSLVSKPTKLKNKHVLSASLIISIVVSCFISLFYGSLKFQNLEAVLLLLLLSLSISINQLIIYFETAKSNIDFISKARLKRGFIAAFLQSFGGLISASLSVLVLSLVFSNFISLRGRLKYILKMACIIFRKPILVRNVIRDKFSFCKFSLPQGILNSISTNMPIIYLGSLGEYKILGLYVIAERFIRSPVNFINIAIRQIFIAEFIKSEDKFNCYLRWLVPLVLIGIILAAFIERYSRVIIDVVLGSDWSEASNIVIILLPWLILSIIQVPASGTFIVTDKVKQYAQIEIIDFSLKTLALVVGMFKNDVMMSLKLFVVVGSLTYIVTVVISFFINLNSRRQ